MSRIVGGIARGRPLSVPPAGTRPTAERAREALFDTLSTLLDLDGTLVLDLYAGSGAVGLEALSRGAGGAVLVESDQAAAQVCRANARSLGLPGAQVVARDVRAWLRAPAGGPFDLVFADPPYAVADEELSGALIALRPLLAPDAVVVVERPARGGRWQWPTPLIELKDRRYGDAVLWYGRGPSAPPSPAGQDRSAAGNPVRTEES